MADTPIDILNYIFSNHLEADFLNSVAYHIGGWSIAEIADREYKKTVKGFRLVSAAYKIDTVITDDDVLTALHNGLYVSTFISRRDNQYQVHFLCHRYPVSMKEQFDEQITMEVLRYIILQTILALRLDTEKKADDYIRQSRKSER